MNFFSWFKSVPRWDAIGWLAVVGFGAYWEVMGAIHRDRTTFTDLVRSTVPVEIRLVVLAVLIWHFCMGPANAKGPRWW
jgi:hypothetical protein